MQAEQRTLSGSETSTAQEAGCRDADRLAAVADGDAEAFAELYDRYVDHAYGMVRQMVGDAGRAEEVVTEAFVEVWRSAGDYDSGCGPVAAWLMTVLHRHAVDMVRDEELDGDRDVRTVVRRSGGPVRGGLAPVDDGRENAGRGGSVQRLLEVLPDVQREPIILAYFGALDYCEVAERLTVEPATVAQLVREGLEQLSQTLYSDGGSGPGGLAAVADDGD